MITPAQRKGFVLQCLPELKDYLLSKVLYWPMGNHNHPLTPGNLLLEIMLLSIDDSVIANNLSVQLNEVTKAWRSKWTERCTQEKIARTRSWAEVAEEQKELTDATYRNDIRNRAIISLLQYQPGVASDTNTLNNLDAKIKKCLVPGPYVWQEQYSSLFEPHTYWFLYQTVNRKG